MSRRKKWPNISLPTVSKLLDEYANQRSAGSTIDVAFSYPSWRLPRYEFESWDIVPNSHHAFDSIAVEISIVKLQEKMVDIEKFRTKISSMLNLIVFLDVVG